MSRHPFDHQDVDASVWGDNAPELSGSLPPGTNPYYGEGAWGNGQQDRQQSPAPQPRDVDPSGFPPPQGQPSPFDDPYQGNDPYQRDDREERAGDSGSDRSGFPPPQGQPSPFDDPYQGNDSYQRDSRDEPGDSDPDPSGYPPPQADLVPFESAPAGYDDPVDAAGEEEFQDFNDPTPGARRGPEFERMGQLLLQVVGDDECTEVICNGPNEILQKVKGRRYHIADIQFHDADTYHAALNEYLLPYVNTDDRIDGKTRLVEGQLELPSGERDVPPILARVHILAPPLTEFAKVTIAKKARYTYDLDGLVDTGALTRPMAEFLKAAARGRLNVVVSGVTGAGKTTLLQALTHYYDQNERIVVIEDTPELRLPIADVVYMQADVAQPGVQSHDLVTIEWLVRQAQRMRMDRIIVGEIRGGEMSDFLISANSGADGSTTSIHAEDPRRALEKMLNFASRNSKAGETTIRREIAATVDIVVQASLIDGRHVITKIEEVSNTVRGETGVIATQTLFEFSRSSGQHTAPNAPSDDLTAMLRNRGVPVNAAWFGRTNRAA